jgi:hypothetical protein
MKKQELNKNLTLQQQKVIDYLQKNELSKIDSNNIAGTVLAFNIRIKNGDKFDKLSLLLFLDFRTGRVERYLINSSNPNLNQEGIDFKEDLSFYLNNVKYRMFYEDVHWAGTSKASLTKLSDMNDGILSRRFYLFFMAELIRDYLFFNNSFLDGNMASLLKVTTPIQLAKFEKITDPKQIKDGEVYIKQNENVKNFYVKKWPSLGTGRLITDEEKKEINNSTDYILKDLTPFEAFKFIEDNNKILTFFVPNQFKSNYLVNLFEKNKINLIYANRNELPQIVQDFVRTLNIKSVKRPQDITLRIKFFNYNIVKRLKNMSS